MSLLEQAELRALTDAAFDLRDGDPAGYRKAVEAIIDWHYRTLPERVERYEQQNGRPA